MNSEKYILLTIDVEDWFQVENFKPWIPFETWDQRELRVERNTQHLLDLFDSVDLQPPSLQASKPQDNYELSAMGYGKSHPKVTFFILGWIAERLPNLVREIQSRGHEVASHGNNHNLCNQQSDDDLKNDLSDSKQKLEDITGAQIFGFRAPNFSINNDILKIIEGCGFFYDSSYNSFGMHGRYGQISLNGMIKKSITHQISENFFELPISNLDLRNPMINACLAKLFRKKHIKTNLTGQPSALSSKRNSGNRFVLPWGGGAYFRLIPYRFFGLGVQSILNKDGAYLFYIHPWEVDQDQPVVKDAPAGLKFRHYSNLSKTRNKLIKLIDSFPECQFITCSQFLSKFA